ncbi:hypothetical protein [Rhizobium lentis]|uniref:Uncharacterized protein n=1 Tax=Rhizobium lentis TaxID=1138194 RepID=A0A7W8UQJ1_9HYPH|nr:hypothetical protein [Rhizobium lentis]MBB4574741.1 hypothetical protein [Rhizobium lentis]MBB5550668.1 hypothetical protein [Rhizobium lentis]MBB5561210.1 hypothetical protein [Rhizobium lentis]MBB5567787.1 hypothetical protein [Rhizobium lentis]
MNQLDGRQIEQKRTNPGETGLAIAARRGLNASQRPSLDSLASPDRRKSIENDAARH